MLFYVLLLLPSITSYFCTLLTIINVIAERCVAMWWGRYSLKTLLLEAADDVSQGATKGNSGTILYIYCIKLLIFNSRYF